MIDKLPETKDPTEDFDQTKERGSTETEHLNDDQEEVKGEQPADEMINFSAAKEPVTTAAGRIGQKSFAGWSGSLPLPTAQPLATAPVANPTAAPTQPTIMIKADQGVNVSEKKAPIQTKSQELRPGEASKVWQAEKPWEA